MKSLGKFLKQTAPVKQMKPMKSKSLTKKIAVKKMK